MTRGYVFEISSNLDLYPLGEMSADSLAGNNLCNVYDSFIDKFADTDDSAIVGLKTALKDAGVIVHEVGTDFWFTITQKNKENWFRTGFAILQTMVRKLSLSQYASDMGLSSRLVNLISGCYEDAVVLDSVFYSLTDFIRSATPGTTYYVNANNFVLMY